MKKTTTLILLFLTLIAAAQDLTFGDISQLEMEEEIHPKYKDADAAYLYKKQKIYFEISDRYGFVLVKEVQERIKIYKKEGVKYAVKDIPYWYFSKPTSEYYWTYNEFRKKTKKKGYKSPKIDKLINIEAYTYNANEDGSFTKTKLTSKISKQKEFVKIIELKG